MFHCKRCGTCCRNIRGIEELKLYDSGTGTCIWLIDNQCSIYSKRPYICNVEKMYEKKFYQYYTKDEYYKLNKEGCEAIRKNMDGK